MKQLRELFYLLCLILLFFIPTSLAAVNDLSTWESIKENPDLYTTVGDYEVHYSFGFPQESGELGEQIHGSMGNVYLIDNREGKDGRRVEHIFFEQTHLDKYTSSSFMLGIKSFNKETDKEEYNVYSSPYRNSKYFRKGSHIYNESEVKTNKDKFKFTQGLEIYPVSDTVIRHVYTIYNKDDKPLTFRGMKNVDTELDGKDGVPVYMLGYNQGLYIEQNGYRINYIMNDNEYGPTNFASFYEYYRLPNRDIINHQSDNQGFYYWPYTPQDITGTGDEAKGYAPDEEPITAGKKDDSGIYMKWDEVTINPGESRDFIYDVSLTGDIGTEYYYRNLNRPDKEYYEEDDVYFIVAGNWDRKTFLLSDGKIETTISDLIELNDTDDVDVIIQDTSTGQNQDEKIIKRLKLSDVYDKEKRTIEVPLTRSDFLDFNDSMNDWIAIGFKGKIKKGTAGQAVEQEGKVTFHSSTSSEEYVRKQPITLYVDEENTPQPITKPKLIVEKTANKESAEQNEVVTYQIELENKIEATAEAINSKIVDYFPLGMGKPNNIMLDGEPLTESVSKQQFYLWSDQDRTLTVYTGDLDRNQKKLLTYNSEVLKGEKNEEKVNRVTFTSLNNLGEMTEDEETVRYKPNTKWQVDFNSMGGSLVNSQTVLDNEKAKEPEIPIFENKKFSGWYSDLKFDETYDFNQPVTKNITLYARWKHPMVNPLDGKSPIKPIEEDNQNPTKEDLRIQYVSDFDFGEHEGTRNGVEEFSQAESVKNKEGNIEIVPPFVSIIDDRAGSNISNWLLTAESDEFINNEGQSIPDAQLIFTDLSYQGDVDLPIASKGSLNIVKTERLVAKSGPKTIGGSWSLSLGKIMDFEKDIKKSSGVVFKSKSNLLNYKGTYQTTIDWNLTPEVKEIRE